MSESLRGWLAQTLLRALWGHSAPKNGLLAFLLALVPLKRTLGGNLSEAWQFEA